MQKLTWEEALDEAYPMVKKLARKHINKSHGFLDYDDLLNVGLEGLYDAYTRYKKSNNTSFITFARFRVNGAIIDEIRKNSFLSRRTFEKVKEYESFQNKLYLLQGRRPSAEEENLFSTAAKLGRVRSVVGDETNIGTNSFTPESELISLEYFKEFSKVLSEKKLNIIKLRYVDGLSLKELSEVYNLSQARISQIIKESIESLNLHILSA